MMTITMTMTMTMMMMHDSRLVMDDFVDHDDEHDDGVNGNDDSNADDQTPHARACLKPNSTKKAFVEAVGDLSGTAICALKPYFLPRRSR